ncbi:ester cyclase [Streptomyces chartreusis]|uniref:ester cyclase n=1 Tax=Streptomyces chartreusis TaxID=1969 RepID=UPI0033BC3296
MGHLSEIAINLNKAFNAGDTERLRELISPDVVAHLAGTSSDAEHPPGTPRDREGLLGVWQLTRAFFPDLHSTLEEIVETGGVVATRSVVRGTHTLDFMGMPPTGKTFEMMTMNMNRVQDGIIVEHWALSDNVTMLAQLGVKFTSTS